MYNTQEAAEALGVTPPTLRTYTKIKQDPLPVMYVGLRKAQRFSEDDIIKFARTHGIAIVKLKQ